MWYILIQVYESALEDQPEYNGFVDFCDTFPIMAGDGNDDDEGQEVIGEFKVRYISCCVAMMLIQLTGLKLLKYADKFVFFCREDLKSTNCLRILMKSCHLVIWTGYLAPHQKNVWFESTS